jgi:hypothetical protein
VHPKSSTPIVMQLIEILNKKIKCIHYMIPPLFNILKIFRIMERKASVILEAFIFIGNASSSAQLHNPVMVKVISSQ